MSIYFKGYYVANREKILKKNKAWNRAHPKLPREVLERVCAYCGRHYRIKRRHRYCSRTCCVGANNHIGANNHRWRTAKTAKARRKRYAYLGVPLNPEGFLRRTCVYCKNQFWGTLKQVYCSLTCRCRAKLEHIRRSRCNSG
jgi:hypothetical protein